MSELVSHLRDWGLKVETKEGYLSRRRPYSFSPRAIIAHHTASGSSSGNFAAESVVTYGYDGLPGPLCQFLLGRDGTVKIISLGYANHAGYGGPRAGVPKDQGNSYCYGIEAENNGIGEPWSAAQLQAYYRLCAALLDHMNINDVERVFGHKEWAPTRKIDPAGLDMNRFRSQVRSALNQGPSKVVVHLKHVGPGKKTLGVLRIKRRLKRLGFFDGALTKNWTKQVTEAYKKYQKSLDFKPKHCDGIPGPTSLEALGFKVVP